MSSTSQYKEYGWATTDSGNGESGEHLTEKLVAEVRKLEGVQRVCDMGCGNGYLAGWLATLGYEVVGVDASASGVELAKSTHPNATFVCANVGADLEGILGLGTFDLVTSADVIEHLYRPADLLEAAFRLLKPRGYLLVGTPYHGYWKNLALSLAGRMDGHFTALWDGGHIKFFSVKTLSTLIEANGFGDVNFTFYGRVPYLWKNMICTSRRRD